jgi:hypothetical protein
MFQNQFQKYYISNGTYLPDCQIRKQQNYFIGSMGSMTEK